MGSGLHSLQISIFSVLVNPLLKFLNNINILWAKITYDMSRMKISPVKHLLYLFNRDLTLLFQPLPDSDKWLYVDTESGYF
jgi:hypothetical protein